MQQKHEERVDERAVEKAARRAQLRKAMEKQLSEEQERRDALAVEKAARRAELRRQMKKQLEPEASQTRTVTARVTLLSAALWWNAKMMERKEAEAAARAAIVREDLARQQLLSAISEARAALEA